MIKPEDLPKVQIDGQDAPWREYSELRFNASVDSIPLLLILRVRMREGQVDEAEATLMDTSKEIHTVDSTRAYGIASSSLVWSHDPIHAALADLSRRTSCFTLTPLPKPRKAPERTPPQFYLSPSLKRVFRSLGPRRIRLR